MGKIKTYKLQKAPCGLPQSRNAQIYNAGCTLACSKPSKSNAEVYLGEPYLGSTTDAGGFKAWNIYLGGGGLGWVYEHELVMFCSTNKETLIEEQETLELELGDVKLKLQWMEENNIKKFDENEFKVYKTLKLLENDDMSTIEKSKLIAKLIKG